MPAKIIENPNPRDPRTEGEDKYRKLFLLMENILKII